MGCRTALELACAALVALVLLGCTDRDASPRAREPDHTPAGFHADCLDPITGELGPARCGRRYPTPQAVTSPAWLVIILPAECRSYPHPARDSGTMNRVVRRYTPGSVVQVDKVYTLATGVWQFVATDQCWLRTDGDRVQLFHSAEEVARAAATVQPIPAPMPTP